MEAAGENRTGPGRRLGKGPSDPEVRWALATFSALAPSRLPKSCVAGWSPENTALLA